LARAALTDITDSQESDIVLVALAMLDILVAEKLFWRSMQVLSDRALWRFGCFSQRGYG
jgi:hypothetical protein